MRNEDIIRAWKEESFRESLGETELAHLPDYPAGMLELDDEDLEVVAGGDLSLALSITLSVATAQFSCFPWGCDDKEEDNVRGL